MGKNNNFKLPNFIFTGNQDSFANYTVRVRFPEIIDRVIEKNHFTSQENKKLLGLKKEIKQGEIIDPFQSDINRINTRMFEDKELSTWKTYISRYVGRNWFRIPWYFSEAYLYLRILIASGYYDENSKFYTTDPFKPIKEEELFSPGGGIETAGKITRFIMQWREDTLSVKDIIKELILLSLWGNRIDLSYNHIVQQAKNNQIGKGDELLIINQIDALADTLLYSKEVHFILDNAGSELVSDLLLTHFLLTSSDKNPKDIRVILHVKKAPFFVSDTTEEDINNTIIAFKEKEDTNLRTLGEELEKLIETNTLIIKKHYFWNGPCGFPEMPQDIVKTLSRSDLTIIKGDANYRRLISDRKWNFSTPMEKITYYFPSDFAILRTMKSELIVGIDSNRVNELYTEDPSWLINGKRGIIQLVKK